MFHGELNGLDVDAADVGNAYLGYGLHQTIWTSPAKVAYSSLSKISMDFGPVEPDGMNSLLIPLWIWVCFYPCKADPDVWMKDSGTHYAFVCVYVDDLASFMAYSNFSFKNSDAKATGLTELGR
jgi:hypothetical protein